MLSMRSVTYKPARDSIHNKMLSTIVIVLYLNNDIVSGSTTDAAVTEDPDAPEVPVLGPIWTYENEKSWPGEVCHSGGLRQSPIDIHTKQVVEDYAAKFIKYGKLQLKGYERVLVSAINNGHTVQFNTEGDESIHPTVSGGPLGFTYRLEQIHFHWLSEHAVNGVKYPMEIHFVHVRSDLEVSEALGLKDGLAVLAVFVLIQSEDVGKLPTAEVMQHVPKLLKPGDRVNGALLDLTKLMSANQNSYYTYLGSLTSPECNEAVMWIIFEEPIHITDDHYRLLFGKIGVSRYNFRSLQRMSQHAVYRPIDSHYTAPKLVTMVTDVFKNVGHFFTMLKGYVSSSFR